MKHTTYQSRPFILSRDRAEGLELVSLDTRELLKLKPEQRSELGPVVDVYLDCVPNLIHFPARPPSFLGELRARREAYLKEARLRKRRGPKVEKSSLASEPRRARAKKVSPALAAAMAHLPPELQQALLRGGKK